MRWASIGLALAGLVNGEFCARAQFHAGHTPAGRPPSIGLAAIGLSRPAFYPGGFGPRYATFFRSNLFAYSLYRSYGWSGYYGWPYYYAPAIVVQPVVIQPVAYVPVDDLPPELNPNDFIIIRPRNPLPPQQGAPGAGRMPPERVNPPRRAPPPPRVPERPRVDLGVRPGELPMEPEPDRNPRAEAVRQIQLGKDAFEQGQYGRAMERFERATAVDPANSLAYFLLAQSRFATGKYKEAVTAIAGGMRRRPDWPTARFEPRDLYGNNVGLFDGHLQALQQAVEGFPEDADLLFLLGYEQWFDGQRPEARKMFERALRRSTDWALPRAFLGS